MSAAAVEAALRAMGVACEAEARDRLVVLRACGDAAAMIAARDMRRAIASLARTHGFTHAALEVTDDVAAAPQARATVPGHQPA